MTRLEYRGYDSAGISIFLDDDIVNIKSKGKVSDLKIKINGEQASTIGIGHTRWATHGEPSNINSHPQFSNSKNLSIVHNGIIENYGSIKTLLIDNGFTFESETDTEVLINFIEYIQLKDKISLEQAVRIALNEVVGAYAIAILDKK